MKDTYDAMRKAKEPWMWSSVVWPKTRIPRHAFITWMALKSGMKMLQKMKEDVVNSDNCVLCWNGTEAEQHVFYECTVARKVWEILKVKMGYRRNARQTWEEELKWIQKPQPSCDIQRDGLYLMFSAMIYWLWKARNEKIFKGSNMTAEGIAHCIVNDVQTKPMAGEYRMVVGAERDEMTIRWGVEIGIRGNDVKKASWTKPVGAMVKLNSDGSWDGEAGYWEEVIRRREGQVLAMAKGKSQYNRIDMIELQGIMYGIEFARRHGYEEIEADTDSMSVKYYLEMEQTPWEVRKMVGKN